MRFVHFLFTMLFLGLSIGNAWGEAKEIPPTDSYFCGFNTQQEFNQWTVINSNDDDETWVWGNEALTYTISRQTPTADDWAISPKIALSGAKQCEIKLKIELNYGWETLAVTIGKGNTVEAQTTVLLDTRYKTPWATTYVVVPLPKNLESGEYNIGIHITSNSSGAIFTLHSVQLAEANDGSVEGVVTDADNKAVANTEVSLKSDTYETMKFKTDAEGKFNFKDLTPGTYKISTKIDGYDPFEGTVDITALTNGNYPIQIKKASAANVSGKVVDEAGLPISSAKVSMKGETSYEATTDKDGVFLIEQARTYDKYQLKIEKDLKVTQTSMLAVVNIPINIGTITMATRVVSPKNIRAEETNSGTLVTWMMPLKETELKIDNGTYGGMVGMEGVGEYSAMGNVFNYPLVVSGMSWLLTGEGGPHNTVDLYVFSLNPDGSLSNKILYSAKNVPNVDYSGNGDFKWSEYSFEKEIEAPYGCILAVGYTGYLGLACDYQGAGSTCKTYDYREEAFTYSNSGNYFIRGFGSPLGTPQMAPSKDMQSVNSKSLPIKQSAIDTAIKEIRQEPIVPQVPYHMTSSNEELTPGEFTYRAWRLNVADKENPEKWTEYTTFVKELLLIDRDFNKLEQGTYQYAVQAIFSNGAASDTLFSNEIEHMMYTDITVELYTNLAIDATPGAIITLKNNQDPTYSYVKVATGKQTLFENVRKGDYALSVTQKGFSDAGWESLKYTSSNSYLEYIGLQLIPAKPFNLDAVQEPETKNVTFSWNTESGIFDDFEGMDDFSLNPAGETGWTYADVDGKPTFGVNFCEKTPYPNMYSPMAFMAFNPSATTPGLLNYLLPHSGKKVLVDVATANAPDQPIVKNDDYLFSPELSFESDFVLNFWAMSGFYAASGNEEFMVGYCKNSATPNEVEWITATPQTVGAIWTEFSYDIPQEAKYVTIRCVSNQHFFFVLDDIYIGYKENLINKIATYDVYMDEELVTKTSERSIKLNNLTSGKHLIKVQAVYPMTENKQQYSDFVELIIKVEEGSDIETIGVINSFSFDSTSKTISFEKAIDQASVFDAQGRLLYTFKNANVISTSEWTSGLYIVKVLSDDQASSHKIFIN